MIQKTVSDKSKAAARCDGWPSASTRNSWHCPLKISIAKFTIKIKPTIIWNGNQSKRVWTAMRLRANFADSVFGRRLWFALTANTLSHFTKAPQESILPSAICFSVPLILSPCPSCTCRGKSAAFQRISKCSTFFLDCILFRDPANGAIGFASHTLK